MSSFYAELEVAGHIYSLRQCGYELTQATDARGQPTSKVRHGQLHLTLDVPADDVLGQWAATPYKPLAGHVTFYESDQRTARETVEFEVGHCVSYSEMFRAGDTGAGAYVCQLVVAAEKLVLKAGGATRALVPATIRDYKTAPGTYAQQGPTGHSGQTHPLRDLWVDVTNDYITDSKKLATIRASLVESRKLMVAKETVLKRWNEADKACFATAFGYNSETNRQLILAQVQKGKKVIDGMLKDDTYKQKFFRSIDGDVAHVAKSNYGTTDHEIFLDDQFFDAPLKPGPGVPHAQAGVLAHEISHFPDAGNTSDDAYGLDECSTLARERWKKAPYNADNYRLYLENQFCK